MWRILKPADRITALPATRPPWKQDEKQLPGHVSRPRDPDVRGPNGSPRCWPSRSSFSRGLTGLRGAATGPACRDMMRDRLIGSLWIVSVAMIAVTILVRLQQVDPQAGINIAAVGLGTPEDVLRDNVAAAR